LSGNPQGQAAAQTLFYMGECLYNQGEFDLAILDYQKVISNHSQDSHTPSALLKQGMSFEKLTDHETAKIIFRKLIADHPDSSEAGLANKRLENL
jgi:TolA-binding protein